MLLSQISHLGRYIHILARMHRDRYIDADFTVFNANVNDADDDKFYEERD